MKSIQSGVLRGAWETVVCPLLAYIGFLAGSLALVGCSTFTTELKSKEFTGKTTPGLTYKLPAKQFSLSVTYQVTGCKVIADNKVNLDADVKATLSERLVGSEAYTISYQDLDAWTKITDTEFHLSEAGLLTGINTSIADQTGKVIQNVVSTATGVARAVALPPVYLTPTALNKQNTINNDIISVQKLLSSSQYDEASSQLFSLENMISQIPGGTEWSSRLRDKSLSPKLINELLTKAKELANQSSPCDEVNTLVKVHEEAQVALKTEQKKDKERDAAKRKKGEAADEIARLTALKDVYEALGKEAAKNGLMARIQEQEKKHADADSELKALGSSGTDKATEALAKAVAKLSITSTLDTLPQKPNEPLEVTVTDKDVPSALHSSFTNTMTVLPKVTLNLRTLTAAPSNKSGDGSMGIAYRIPVAAMARVICECQGGELRTLIAQSTQVPQFGPLGSLDLKNGAFANNTLEVVFNSATGAPDKLVFHSKSRAETASSSARDAASSYLQLQKDKRDDILAANKASIDQQNALLGLEKTRNDVALASTQAAAAAALLPVTTEKSIVEAQIDLLRDQQRLDAVRTGTASAAEVQLEALVNQQKLLEQQLKIMQIEQQIAEQKAKIQTNIEP